MAKNADKLDDLLSLGGPAKAEPAAPDFDQIVETPVDEAPMPDITSVVQDDEDAEIAALKAALAQPVPTPAAARAERELTPKEIELRELRDQMAQRQALIAETAPDQFESADGKESVLIHVLQDGFTINGLVTYRGQEFEFLTEGRAYEQTKNRNGLSWLRLTEDEQYDRWGEARFGHGPWPFKRLSALTLADLPEGSTKDDLEAVKRAAARNDRRAPVANL